MDPNATLEAIRKAIATAEAQNDAESYAAWIIDAVSAFEDLDEWLTRGGSVPDAWDNRDLDEWLTRGVG